MKDDDSTGQAQGAGEQPQGHRFPGGSGHAAPSGYSGRDQGPADNPWQVDPWRHGGSGTAAEGQTHPQQPVPAGAPRWQGEQQWSARPDQGGQQAWSYDAAPSGPAGPPPAGSSASRSPRKRPGWTALAVVGLVAALVGGGAAVGIEAGLDHSSATTATAALAPSSSSSSSSSSTPPVTQDTSTGVSWTSVADAVAPSTVTIEVQSQTAAGEGSGIVLDKQGRILTNYHVVNGAGSDAQMRVVLSDGRVYDDVTVVGQDASTDLAVLQLTDPPSDLQPATLGDSSKVVVGQPVMAVGNPLGLTDTVTTGIVSALDRPVETQQESTQSEQSPFPGLNQQEPSQDEQVVTNAIQTDAAINPGNSGGALVDATGTVIGINSSIASTGTSSSTSQSGSIGLGFAIPINEAKRIADELISDGDVSHPLLGVTLTDATATASGTTRLGAGVQDVSAGSAAADAGLKSGDVITAVDGTAVNSATSLTAVIREQAPGATVQLTVVRDGQEQTLSATLGSREEG